jgi:HEPN domain-containing protein
MSPKAKRELAREHLSTARRELAAGELVPAIMFLHLAGEAAVVALAETEGIDTCKRHDRKADAARELFRRGIVSEDLSEALRSLNQVRKDATYEGEDPDLSAEDLEELVDRIETIVLVAEGRAVR